MQLDYKYVTEYKGTFRLFDIKKSSNIQTYSKKLISWIRYEENKPKTKYDEDKDAHDKYRKCNDLDCVLRGGE